MNSIEKNGFPSLFYAAESAAAKARDRYLFSYRTLLILTMFSVFSSAIAPVAGEFVQHLRIISGSCLVATMLLSSGIKGTKLERKWYSARAVAESVKTRAWRYCTCAEPYLGSLAAAVVDGMFSNDLGAILKETKELSLGYSGAVNSMPQISGEMRAMRTLSWNARCEQYLGQRVANQRAWYSTKASESALSDDVYFGLVLLAQGLATFWAFLLAAKPTTSLNLVGVFTSSVAALLAWVQVRKFGETSESYSLTSQEVGIIETQANHVTNDQEFSRFVADAENAFSREHTLWVARRDSE